LGPAFEARLATRAYNRSVPKTKDLEQRLATRKLVERAKGLLMDDLDMKENEAFRWIQRRAMDERKTMKDIAERILDGSLRPEPPGPPSG